MGILYRQSYVERMACILQCSERAHPGIESQHMSKMCFLIHHLPTPTGCATSCLSAVRGSERVPRSFPLHFVQRPFQPSGRHTTGAWSRPVKTSEHTNTSRCAIRGQRSVPRSVRAGRGTPSVRSSPPCPGGRSQFRHRRSTLSPCSP